jgi:hypothetical protein
MSEIERLLVEEEDGETYTILLQSQKSSELPTPEVLENDADDDESMGFTGEEALVKLKEVHGTIRAYAKYAIGAFKNLGGAEVEELKLKFGIKIEAKSGLPILTGGSAGANFDIEVKCKFPKTQSNLSSS